jgi:hypothetical protein
MLGKPIMCTRCQSLLESSPDEINETLAVREGELPEAPKPQRIWHSAELGDNPTIELRVDGTACEVSFASERLMILGREDAESDSVLEPDVDLGPYEALDEGVSRVHAALMVNDGSLMVKDMGSTNGTFLNGYPVSGLQWRMVRNQDELQLGTLKMIVQFKN